MGVSPTYMDKTSLILKRDESGRVRMPLDRRAALIGEYERSGLPASKFGRLVRVPYNTFWNWLREHGLTARQGKKGRTSPRLVEVCIVPTKERPTTPPAGLHISLPGGAQLTIRDAVEVSLAAQLLKALATSC